MNNLSFILIKNITTKANVAVLASLDSNTAQFDHGLSEGFLEADRVLGPVSHYRFGSGISVEDLVRSEEALALYQILVVPVVELSGRDRVHIHRDPWVDILWAHLL